MASAEFRLVYARDLGQWYPNGARGDGETPEDVAEFFHHGIAVERTPLHDVLAHVAQHFSRFLREPCRPVEQLVLCAQRRIQRARRCVLIRIELAAQL